MIEKVRRLSEALRERRALRYVVAYAVGAWIAAQVAGFFVENGYTGRRFLDVVLFLLAAGFAATLVLVWYHGEKGHQRVTRSEGAILIALVVATGAGTTWVATREAESEPSFPVLHDLGEGSVAVLPFHSKLTDPSLEWLDQGIADLLATDLAQIETLRVVSGQRIFDLLRQEGIEDARRVPEELEARIAIRAGARFMLVGSVLGSSSRLSVNAQLVNLETGEIEASAREQGSDVFGLVDRLSAAMSSQILDVPVEPTELTPVAQLTTANIEAYRHFWLGREANMKFQIPAAADHFQQAVDDDSTFAIAHFHLAGVQVRMGDITGAVEHLAAAERHLGSTSERDRLFIEGIGAFIRGDPELGKRRLRELVRKYPEDKEARIALASALGFEGSGDEQRRLLEETLALDPYYAPAHNTLAYYYAERGDFQRADSLISRYVELEPGQPNPLDSRGEILEFAGRYDEARELYRQALRIQPDFVISLSHLVRTYLREDDAAGARAELAELEMYASSDDPAVAVPVRLLTGDTHLWEGQLEPGLAAYAAAVDRAESAGRVDLQANALRELLRAQALLERFDEAADGARALRELQPLDGYAYTVMLRDAGRSGDFDSMESMREGLVATFSDDPRLAPFFESALAGFDIYIAFYRGDHEAVLRTAETYLESGISDSDGYPVLRSTLALGRGADALEKIQLLRRTGLIPGLFRFDPLHVRHMRYFEGRAAELTGDTALARAAFAELVDAWGDRLSGAPLMADAADRLTALSPPEIAEPR